MTLLDDPLLTVNEAAHALKISVSTARRHIRSGQLPAIQIGRQWRVPLDDLEALIDTSYRPPTAAWKAGGKK